MKEFFKNTRFTTDSLRLIEECNIIIEDYLASDLTMTVRQLYYQLVSANSVPNDEKSYNKVKGIVSKARLAGLMDWDAIEDRARKPDHASEWDSIKDVVGSALRAYRLPRLQGQEDYVEVWCEKDALAGVIKPITDKFHLVLMINRGYSSQSAMYASANRIRENQEEYGCDYSTVLYIGDLDPSGEDMVRDIDDRLRMFECPCNVEKLAPNFNQVEEYKLPPNPAKLTDTRAAAFIAEYGYSSWEVDAIPPRVLQALITVAVGRFLDLDKMKTITDKEEEDKKNLRAAMTYLDKPPQ